MVTASEIAYVTKNDTTKFIFVGEQMELMFLIRRKYFILRRGLRSLFKFSVGADAPAVLPSPTTLFPETYHLMIRIFRSGRIEDVTKALPCFAEVGIRQLWLSPLHSQSRYTDNDHGYWPDNHSDIDPMLGDEVDLRNLIHQARRFNIQILMDAPINHVGYHAKFQMGGKRISLTDPGVFRKKVASDAKDSFLWSLLNDVDDSQQFEELQKKVHERPLWGLPTFAHENKELQDYLFESYRAFIDQGITSFRIDAANIIPINFQIEFINQLTEYGEKTGKQIFFLLDLWFGDRPLSFFLDRMLPRLLRKNVFIDDTHLTSVMRLALFHDFSFAKLKDLLRSRMENGKLQELLVVFPESHDYKLTIKKEFEKLVLYLVGEFTSLHPLILHHGKEDAPEHHRTNRDRFSQLKFDSSFFQVFSSARKAIAPFKDKETSYTLEENPHDEILILKRGKLVLIVGLGKEITYQCESGKKVFPLVSHGSVHSEDSSVTLSGKAILLLRID